MRLWSLHPKYLDSIGLIALWREALLARCVLEGKTKGYQNHPQLQRFKNSESPLRAINFYLKEVYQEACKRNFCFDVDKVDLSQTGIGITVTTGQLAFEVEHLKNKLQKRDLDAYQLLCKLNKVEAHPLFKVIEGEIESWEKIRK